MKANRPAWRGREESRTLEQPAWPLGFYDYCLLVSTDGSVSVSHQQVTSPEQK